MGCMDVGGVWPMYDGVHCKMCGADMPPIGERVYHELCSRACSDKEENMRSRLDRLLRTQYPGEHKTNFRKEEFLRITSPWLYVQAKDGHYQDCLSFAGVNTEEL